MVWEVDDRSTGVIKLDQIRTVLKRLQKSKKRMPGTGTNLLRTLIEFMMFDRCTFLRSPVDSVPPLLTLSPLSVVMAARRSSWKRFSKCSTSIMVTRSPCG